MGLTDVEDVPSRARIHASQSWAGTCSIVGHVTALLAHRSGPWVDNSRDRSWHVLLYDLATTRKQGIIDIAVLVSGSGSNLQALIETPDLGSQDRNRYLRPSRDQGTGAGRGGRARDPVLPWDRFASRQEFSLAVADAVEAAEPR